MQAAPDGREGTSLGTDAAEGMKTSPCYGQNRPKIATLSRTAPSSLGL